MTLFAILAGYPSIHLALFGGDMTEALKVAELSPKHPKALASSNEGIYSDGTCGVSVEYKGKGGIFTLIPSCFDEGNINYGLDIYSSISIEIKREQQ